jgi:Ca2+-binding RTX toxin-like protein
MFNFNSPVPNENALYLFGTGSGNDTILEGMDNILGAMLISGVGFSSEDFSLSRIEDDLVFTSKISTDQLTIAEYFKNTDAEDVEFFEFDSDGTVWTEEDVNNLYLASINLDGDDIFEGTHGDDIIDLGLGNDTVTDPGGSDTYIYEEGDGQDKVFDKVTFRDESNDQVVFGPGLTSEDLIVSRNNERDLTLSFSGHSDDQLTIQDYFHLEGHRIETFQFHDGTTLGWTDIKDLYFEQASTPGDDEILGTKEDDVIVLGPGNDEVTDYGGSDIYMFQGGGQIIISDLLTVKNPSDDRVMFGSGFSPSDAIFSADSSGRDLMIEFAGSSDSLTVIDQLVPSVNGEIEYFEFFDGTVWTAQQVAGWI